MPYDLDVLDREPKTPPWREQLAQNAQALGDDEGRVLVAVSERLVLGRRRYGALRLVDDGRDFVNEALDEVVDCAIYLVCDQLRGGR